ncbi:hypothetical protein M513_12004 [Trichuris suis]|uniref:DUF4371 domain-containing protein n=1 Tax=Trichuris suis TaxID=68888 RepID=A0A085LQ48_9BILA|nr:hypothetical protein M513_12004 [Trichuris suis]
MTPHPPSDRSLIDHFIRECGRVKFQFVPQVYNLGRTLNQMGRFVPPILDFTFELAPGILSFLSHCTCFYFSLWLKLKKCRQYNLEYLKYGFIPSPASKLHSLWEKFRKRPTLRSMVSSALQEENDGLLASYNISLIIAKSEKPHSIWKELLLPVISEVLRTLLHISPTEIIRKIPLSNNTVQRRISEMSSDTEETLCNFLRTTSFALQLDESTLRRNEILLLAYARFLKDDRLTEELLFAKELVTDTKGESIYRAVEEFFKEKNIHLANIMSVATDGAPSMVGSQRGFIAHLKEVVPGVLAVHCVIHRQHLVGKHFSDRLSCSLQFVISAVNKIKISCEANDEDFNRLLLHTEVRWLSKGTCLSRFHSLFATVLEFLGDDNDRLRDNLKKFENDIAYLT